MKPSEKITHKTYQVPHGAGFLTDLIRIEIEGSKLQFLFKMREALTDICERFLNNTKFLEELQGFDLIIYDSLAACPAVMHGERFDIPRVEIMPLPPNAPFALIHMIPMPVSYVPQLLTGFSDKMTVVERIVNLGVYFGANLLVRGLNNRQMNAIKVKYNIKPERSFGEAAGDVQLVLITADFPLEYAQPLLPGR